MALWPYVIANARIDEDSKVELNPNMLAGIFGEPVDLIEKAIGFLCSPDPNSRTSTEDGRRLIKVGSFAYKVVNLEKYRNSECDDTRRKYWKEYRRTRRASGKDLTKKPNKTPPVHVNAISVHKNVHHADADADADTKTNGERKLSPVERIGLEKERERLEKRVQSLKINEFRTTNQTQEMKDGRVRIQKIDAALHIQL